MVKRITSVKKVFFLIVLISLIAAVFSCKKKNVETEALSENPSEDISSESSYDFYLPSEDDADWVDSVLLQAEEERIANELSKMEDTFSEYQFDESEVKNEDEEGVSENPAEETEPEESNPVDKFFEEAKEGRVLSGKNDQLSFYEFDNEILAPKQTSEGLVIVKSSGQNISRSFYNLQYQLYKKEEWQIKSVKDAQLIKTENFTFSQETGKVIKKKIITDSTVENISYNTEGNPSSSEKYAVVKGKNYILQERSWTYDSENRVLTDLQTEYNYKDENYKKLDYSFKKKYEYSYNAEEIPPDVTYYENGLLKMKNLYTTVKGQYCSWVYFDENLSIKSYYEDDIRVRDEYFNGGRLIRTKLYDKPKAEGGENSENENKAVIKKESK